MILIVESPAPPVSGWRRCYFRLGSGLVPPQYYLVTTPTYYLLTVIPLSIRPSYPKSTFLSLPRDRVSMINLVGPGFNPNPYFTGSAMQVNLDLTGCEFQSSSFPPPPNCSPPSLG